MRAATATLVRSFGYCTRAFACAEEYLGSGVGCTCQCVISDVQMSGMNGLEMQGRLIADGDLTPIIFVTAFPDDKLRSRALASGAVAFLIKPFTGDALNNCIERALRRSEHAPTLTP